MTTSAPTAGRVDATAPAAVPTVDTAEGCETSETAGSAEPSRRRHWLGFDKDLAPRVGPRNHLSPAEVLAAVSELPTWPAPGSREHWQRPARGVSAVLAWLLTHPGEGWQDRWLASGADQNLEWLSVIPAESPHAAITKKTVNSYGLFFLLLGKVVIPHYDFTRIYGCQVLFKNYRQAWWSKELLARIDAAADEFGMHRRSKAQGVRILTKIALCTGLDVDQLTTEHFHQYREWAYQRRGRAEGGQWPAWDLLRGIGVFPRDLSLRDEIVRGQWTPTEMVDYYGVKAPGIRQVLIRYLTERRASIDYNSLRNLAGFLAGLFWTDIEAHHPGIDTLHLPSEIVDAWKERVRFQLGKPGERPRPRKEIQTIFTHVRAFYMDLQEWALEDPSWVPWAVPSPIRREDSGGQGKRRKQVTAEIHQRIRERLPHLPALVTAAEHHKHDEAEFLALAKATAIGETFEYGERTYRRITSKASVIEPAQSVPSYALIEDVQTGKRTDLAKTEDYAFWSWAVIETLRHTGVRAEELTEITQLALVSYRLPRTGELVPMLQIVPSKLAEERLLLVSPELANVLASIITRLREHNGGTIPAVSRWDAHERVHSPALPHLFQRKKAYRSEVISYQLIQRMVNDTMARAGIRDTAGKPLTLTAHDFRRMFATEAVNGGLPIHIAARLLGHHSLATTQSYTAVFQDDLVRSYRAFLEQRRAMRPEAEYRAPTDEEWQEFQQHFELRKLELGECGRPYGTPCKHEHACIRCPMLRVDPRQRARLIEIVKNLKDRVAEAQMNGWLGEVDGLQVSLEAAKAKLTQLNRISTPNDRVTHLGMPVIRT
jgi:site-specific recombinase XerD